MSLRARLVIASVVTLAAGMAVLCLAGNTLLAHTVKQDASQQLSARLDTIVASLEVANGQIEVNGALSDAVLDQYAWVIRADGHEIEVPDHPSTALRAAVQSIARSPTPVQRDGPDDRRLGVRPITFQGKRLGSVVADLPTTTLESLQQNVLVGSIVVALLTLLVGVLAIRRALNAALAPVDQMTRDAEAWGAHDLDRRFHLGPPRDEISALAATLDQLLERIASSRRHEQRFASEVAHELRTPLGAILGTAELAADAGELSETKQALAQIETHSRRIATTLDTLMAFARRESNAAAEGVDVEAVARDFEDVVVALPAGPLPRIEGDPALVRQMLAPVVDNARRYAATRVTIELTSAPGKAVITVRDDGPGVDPALGDDVLLPGVGDSGDHGGAGLGLPLAVRLARAGGGELTVGDGPGGCFVLTLPATERRGAARRGLPDAGLLARRLRGAALGGRLREMAVLGEQVVGVPVADGS